MVVDNEPSPKMGRQEDLLSSLLFSAEITQNVKQMRKQQGFKNAVGLVQLRALKNES